MKPIIEFEFSDFDSCKVWRFSQDEVGDVDYDNVEPVRKEALIFEDDVLVMVSITATLYDGTKLRGSVEVSGDPPEIHPGTSLESDHKYFRLMLPPAPPFVVEKEGPAVFAKFLGLNVNQVFPIRVQTDVVFRKTGKPIVQLLTTNGVESA